MPKNIPTEKRFFHRDISWLNFNRRVFEEALSSANPLMERLLFFAIFVNNLDEFHAVRIANLRNVVSTGFNKKGKYGYYAVTLLPEILKDIRALLQELYDVYEKKSCKELVKNGIVLCKAEDLNLEETKFVQKFFMETLFPMMTPLGVDPGHPFPLIPSQKLSFAVLLQKQKVQHLALVPIPKNVPRLVKLPTVKNEQRFILIEDLIRPFLKAFFKGYVIKESFVFRIIRDSEFDLEEELTPDLLKAIEDEIRQRTWGDVIYLETERDASPLLLDRLCEGLPFEQDQVTSLGERIDLKYLFELYSKVSKPELCFPSHVPHKIPYDDIFSKIAEEDFINHLPYQSFYPVRDLVQSAAEDENVLAIKMTLYRTNSNSFIIQALKDAAQNGKQVTVLVEIKARFDEENNIRLVRDLEAAGCHVIYGIPGLKIHSKVTLVVRKEEGLIRRYVHLATGNYNEKTAKVYTDIGYFTANDDVGREVSEVFNVITGFSDAAQWRRITAAPHNLRDTFAMLIEREIGNQKKYGNGRIWAKMNSLEDTEIIERLYAASSAGVKIQLVVRGICCLIPGRDGLSENIEVRSIVGRFLEHSRIYVFNNNGNSRVFLASADWMQRNLDRRIELMFEVYKEDIKNHFFDIIQLCWRDNQKARVILPHGGYQNITVGKKPFNVQDHFIDFYRDNPIQKS